MHIKTINTRLLVSIVSNLKKQEIEHCRLKINKLNQLMNNHPDQSIYTSHYKIVKSRLEKLLNTSNGLEHLKKDVYNLKR